MIKNYIVYLLILTFISSCINDTSEDIVYYKTGEVKKKVVRTNKGSVLSIRHYDKNGVLYNERLSKEKEIVYLYYPDTSLFQKSYMNLTLDAEGNVREMSEDSAFFYKEGEVRMKLIKNSKFILTYFQNAVPVKVDSFKSYRNYDSARKRYLKSDQFYKFDFDDAN